MPAETEIVRCYSADRNEEITRVETLRSSSVSKVKVFSTNEDEFVNGRLTGSLQTH